MNRALIPDPAARDALRRQCEEDLAIDYERPQTQDDRLDEFYLWAGLEQRPAVSRSLRRLAIGAALGSVLSIALALAIVGYL